MRCSKQDFLSVIDPWRGKACFVIVLSERLELKFWAILETLDTGANVTLSGIGRPGKFLFHLGEAQDFEFGDARAIEDLDKREILDSVFDQVVYARFPNELIVTVFLPRE